MHTLLLFIFINIFCYRSISAGSCKGETCPICTDPATYPDDQIDQTVRCKTEPSAQSFAEIVRCPVGQAKSSKIFSEPMISDAKKQQYYRICKPLEICSSGTTTRCTSILSSDKTNIQPLKLLNFRKISSEIFKSVRPRGKTLYYYKYKPHLVTGKISIAAETRKGLKGCDVADVDEPCVSNCVHSKISLPKSCEAYAVYKGKKREQLTRIDVSGIMFDEVDKCKYYQCGPAQHASLAVKQPYFETLGVDENILLVFMSVASLIVLYACCCSIVGLGLGFWIGGSHMHNDRNHIEKPQNIAIAHD